MTLLQKLNRILDKQIKIKLIILLAATVTAGLIEMLTLAMTFPLIEMVLGNTGVSDSTYVYNIYGLLGFESDTLFIAFYTFTLAAVYFLRGVYVFMLQRTNIYFLARGQAAYSKKLLRKVLGFSYLYHTHKNISEIQRIFNGDVSELFSMLMQVMLFLADFFMTVFMMGYLFYTSPVMTACVVGLALLCLAIYFMLFRKRIGKAGRQNRNASIDMYKAINQLFGGIKEVKILHRENYFEGIFAQARDRYVKSVTKFKTLDIIPKHLLEIIFFSGAFLLMGIFMLSGSDISSIAPQLALFVMAALRILPSITKQVNNINYISFHRVSIDAVYHNLFVECDIEPRRIAGAYESGQKAGLVAGDIAAAGDIEICNVSFKYPKTDEQVISDVSFTIPHNKSVALVGPSGTGKTTLADLILGVLVPDSGQILYNGKPIHSNNEWHKTVGYIPQVIYLLDESILANIAYGIHAGDIDEDKAWHALEQAQLTQFVKSLPDGINTVVGDRGVRLSGGQRQRIGIARAIYEDPPVLVLDEATSSLDNETEKAVMEAIMGFHGNKTLLIVAHRLSTIEHCDIIYKVEGKKVTRER